MQPMRSFMGRISSEIEYQMEPNAQQKAAALDG
jgi:hypothetical protein